MHSSFILLPICLYLGIAGQAIGLYLFGIAVPWLASHKDQSTIDGTDLVKLGILLAGAWLLFPIANVLNSLFALWDLTETSQTPALPIRRLLSSKLSSTWIISAVALLFIGRFSNPKLKISKIEHSTAAHSYPQSQVASQIIQSFILGFVIASTLFGLYFLIQHFTGFDYRLEGNTLGANRMMGDGRYRVSGFFGHPLSAAGATLSIFTFFWVLTFSWGKENWTTTLPDIKLKHLFKVNGNTYRILTGYIALINLAMLFFTGGRTAILAGVAIICLTPVFLRHRKVTLALRLSAIFTIAISSLIAIIYSGVHHRFLELTDQIQAGSLRNVERFVFWKVYIAMISDSPMFGHGAAHISEWIRDAYYNKLGYETFHQKYNAHSIYLETVASIGVVGMTVLSISIYRAHRVFSQWAKNTALLQPIYLAILVSLGANALHGLTQNVFFDANVVVIYFGFLWAFFWTANRTQCYPRLKVDASTPSKPPQAALRVARLNNQRR